jgi:hypothetical protein
MTLLQLAVKWFNENEPNKNKHIDAKKLKRRFQSSIDKRKSQRPNLPYPQNKKNYVSRYLLTIH